MGLIYYQGEPLARQLADLLGNHRELLQRGDDDGLAGLQRLLELPGGGVDVLHDAQRLLELPHRCLELAIQHPAVGNYHDGVEHPAVVRVVEGGQLMGPARRW